MRIVNLVLVAADAATTLYALRRGLPELNPAARRLIRIVGPLPTVALFVALRATLVMLAPAATLPVLTVVNAVPPIWNWRSIHAR